MITVTGALITAAGVAAALGLGIMFAQLPMNGGPAIQNKEIMSFNSFIKVKKCGD